MCGRTCFGNHHMGIGFVRLSDSRHNGHQIRWWLPLVETGQPSNKLTFALFFIFFIMFLRKYFKKHFQISFPNEFSDAFS
jgi:hypothetical protein